MVRRVTIFYPGFLRPRYQCTESDLYESGDLVRIGPNWLMTSDPDSVRYMSAAKHKHGKSSWYLPLKPDPYVHSVFSETNIDNHDRRRALMQSGVSEAPKRLSAHC